jgi:hypothetical protein
MSCECLLKRKPKKGRENSSSFVRLDMLKCAQRRDLSKYTQRTLEIKITKKTLVPTQKRGNFPGAGWPGDGLRCQ